jgi:hypothetical protein
MCAGTGDVASTARAEPRGAASLALLLLVPVPSLGTAASMLWWPGSPWGQGLFVAAKLWIVALPLAWWLGVERRRPSRSPTRAGGFRAAAGLGVGIGSTIVLVYWITRRLGLLDPETVAARAAATGLADLRLYVLGAAYWIAINSLLEEFVWRWFVFRRFERLLGGWPAVGAAALAFTAHHVLALGAQFSLPLAALGSLGVLAGGALWSWLYLRYRSIWPCYLSHAIADVPIFVIGYRLIFAS